jgi:hypothetical protein
MKSNPFNMEAFMKSISEVFTPTQRIVTEQTGKHDPKGRQIHIQRIYSVPVGADRKLLRDVTQFIPDQTSTFASSGGRTVTKVHYYVLKPFGHSVKASPPVPQYYPSSKKKSDYVPESFDYSEEAPPPMRAETPEIFGSETDYGLNPYGHSVKASPPVPQYYPSSKKKPAITAESVRKEALELQKLSPGADLDRLIEMLWVMKMRDEDYRDEDYIED